MKTYYKFIKENIDENIIINQIHLNEFDIRFSFVSPWTNAIVYIYDNDIMIFDIKNY